MSSKEQLPAAATVPAQRSRRDLLRTGGAATIAGLLGVFGLTTSTAAKNGDALRAGEKTSATKPTTLESKKGPAFQGRVSGGKDGIGLRGSSGSPKGVGVQGEATSGKGASVGVQGLSESPAGIAGQFVAAGAGTGVEAEAGKQGVALRTKGRLELTERSGMSSVSGGAEFVIPVAGGLSEKSIVLATLQDHFPGVHVESASVLDADDGLIVVRLNQAVPEPARVGWLVLD